MFRTAGMIEVGDYGVSREPAVRPLGGRRFAGKSLLEWVVRRVTDSQHLDLVVVVSGEDPQQRQIASLAPADVNVFVSRRRDPLGRMAAAAQQYRADAIVRVKLGTPLIDPAMIDRLVIQSRTHPDLDYISYCFSDGRPAVLSKLGLFAEWCRTESLLLADRLATDPIDRRDVTRFIYCRPEQFDLRLAPVPPQLDRDDVRLTVDVEEDWEHLQTIYEALGPDSLDWQRIAGLLDQHPAIRARMASLNRAEAAS